jgi:hypothetical protein
MSTRAERRELRLARQQIAFYEAMGAVTAALLAGNNQLAERRLPALWEAGQRLAEAYAVIDEARQRRRRYRRRR